MRINIIGDGSAGQRHARMLRERGHICTVLGPQTASPVQHPECEAVVIASPPSSHKLYLSWYWDRCPILCEGPVTRCSPVWRYSHMVASNWLFVPQVMHLKNLLLDHKAVIAHLWFDFDLARWRPQTDYRTTCYYTDGIDLINHHEVTTALWLLGGVKQLSVHKSQTGKSLECDALTMNILHRGDTLTTINSSWHAAHYQRGIRVVFEDGRVEECNWGSPQDDGICNQSYAAMLDHWLEAIEHNKSVKCSLRLGYEAYKALQGEVV